MIATTRRGTGDVGDPKIAIIDITRFVDKYDNGVFDETIYWDWPFETTPGEDISQADLIDSEDYGKPVTASIRVTGYEILDEIGYITDKTAEINGVRYSTLQEALDAVPTNNTETTIKLLRNTSEILTVSQNQNIVFNLRNYTISNSDNNPVISNFGTITIINGTIASSAPTQGAVNNKSGAQLTMTGGSIVATGNRQAIYNDGGTVEIKGTAYLSAVSTARSTVQNQAGGTLTITGGTIISSGLSAVDNRGTMTIGTKDGNVNSSSPILQGLSYGISSSTNFKFYDGIAKGSKNGALNNLALIEDKETEYEILKGTEVIDGVTYKTARLAKAITITFNANGGTLSESTRTVDKGEAIGTLPVATRSGYEVEGWYTDQNDGEKVTSATIIGNDTTLYAHWTEVISAEINGTTYKTLQEAINAVPTNNIETTVKLLRNTTENVTVNKNKKIVFDLQTYTISNNGNSAVITNNGTITISNGTITSTASTTSAINNNQSAVLTVSGGRIIATGQRQAIYNDKGTVLITGTAYLSASAPERGTVHNLASSTLIITGGTIISENQQAVNNLGTLTVGTKDGNINTNSPLMQGATYGVTNTGTFEFYDGIAKGMTAAVSGNITDIETNSVKVESTETIDGETYHSAYLGAE